MFIAQFIHTVFLLFKFVSAASAQDVSEEDVPEKLETCLDHKGKVVSHGDRFFPLGSDPCTQCTCLNGKPEMCIAVFCSPPENCRQYQALSDKCCEFVCLDRDFPSKGSGNSSYPGKDESDSLNTTNLGLRLVASTVTSFLILALLLFMIHRLRQRRLLLMIRRFHARRMDNGTAHLSRRFSEDDDGSVGYFVGHDHLDFSRYDEPPPPYTLWKPPEMYIPPGEAPPPYDLSVQLTAPFAGGRRYNAGASSAQNEAVQTSSAPENRTSGVQSVTAATSVFTVANHSQMSQSSEHVLNVPTTSSGANHQVDVETHLHSRAVLPPDLQYDEPDSCSPTVSSAGAAAVSSAVQEESTHDEQTVAATTAETTTTTAAAATISADCTGTEATDLNREVDIAATQCTCNMYEDQSWSKRHSCSDFVEQSHPKAVPGRPWRDKRLSLGATTQNQNNNPYPDPTVWNGEPSESSSSSSPTYDQATPSPSTSDSSFADTEFSHTTHQDPNSGRKDSAVGPHPETPKVSSHDSLQAFAKNLDSGDDDARAPPFQKTLSHLKRFSLIKRRKKKRQDGSRPAEISCSVVCHGIPDTVPAAPQPLAHLAEPDLPAAAKSGIEGQSARPMEAINPHIGHKLASSGLRRCSRPTSIAMHDQSYKKSSRDCNRSSAGSFYSSVNACGPPSSAASVHHRSRTKCSRTPGAESSNAEERGNVMGQAEVPTTVGSPSSHFGSRITRSGSICSETGERRYHKSSAASPNSSASQQHSAPRDADGCQQQQQHHQHHHHHHRLSHSHKSQYLSAVSVPNNARTYRIDLGNLSRNSCTIQNATRTLPVWIVNSESILPKPECSISGSSFGILSRCLSAGQIGENPMDQILGRGLHPALQIRDPSMCDNSWEACSHL